MYKTQSKTKKRKKYEIQVFYVENIENKDLPMLS